MPRPMVVFFVILKCCCFAFFKAYVGVFFTEKFLLFCLFGLHNTGKDIPGWEDGTGEAVVKIYLFQ